MTKVTTCFVLENAKDYYIHNLTRHEKEEEDTNNYYYVVIITEANDIVSINPSTSSSNTSHNFVVC